MSPTPKLDQILTQHTIPALQHLVSGLSTSGWDVGPDRPRRKIAYFGHCRVASSVSSTTELNASQSTCKCVIVP